MKVNFILCAPFSSYLSVSPIQATVLEEMPPFLERESSILALLKRKKPGRVPDTVESKENKSPARSPINAVQVRLGSFKNDTLFLVLALIYNVMFFPLAYE